MPRSFRSKTLTAAAILAGLGAAGAAAYAAAPQGMRDRMADRMPGRIAEYCDRLATMDRDLSPEQVRDILAGRLAQSGEKNIKIGTVTPKDGDIVTIEIVTEGPLLVFRLAGEKSGPGTRVDLEVGVNEIDGFELVVDRVDAVCRAAPVGPWGAIFDPGVSLRAVIDAEGRLIVEADGEPAWWPGNRRLAVAWYRPGSSGYLSVFARERSGWTSSP